MYGNSNDLTTIMVFTIGMGILLFWLFGVFAQRDSDKWEISLETKKQKIRRIVMMVFFGLLTVLNLVTLIISWNNLANAQIILYSSSCMINAALFYYAYKICPSPRGTWVKVRKIIAYIFIYFLYIGIWDTTATQITTGEVSGVYGNPWRIIIIGNLVVYGISALIIWLLLRIYKWDKYIPYTSALIINDNVENTHKTITDDTQPYPKPTPDFIKETPVVNEEEVPNDKEDIEEVIDEVPSECETTTKKEESLREASMKTKNSIRDLLKKILKWFIGIIILASLITGAIFLYKHIKYKRAVAEIVAKFESEETRTEYAMKILSENTEWESVKINNEMYNRKEEAFQWIESKAYEGDPECQFYLGSMYYSPYSYLHYEFRNKNRKKENQEKAAYWWLESAKNGHTEAANNIGYCYKEGDGVKKDMAKAAFWFKKAAESGSSMAQLNYGDLFVDGVVATVGSHTERKYDHGYGITTWGDVVVYEYDTLVPQNIEKAKYWWRLSAAQGNEEAKNRLQKIYE